MEAQIIGVWTAFNTLTTELAVAAITEWPKCLNHYKKQKIDLGDLLEAGDDQEWKGRIGDLARLFIGFDSFAKTVEAYERLFDESVSDVIKRKPLKMASVVRNQCIHEACIVTKKFLGDAKLAGIEPWQSATVGELLPINGRAIAELCEEVIQGANDLILALDSWLGKLPRLAKTPPLPAE
jgi:hypothetical protein